MLIISKTAIAILSKILYPLCTRDPKYSPFEIFTFLNSSLSFSGNQKWLISEWLNSLNVRLFMFHRGCTVSN